MGSENSAIPGQRKKVYEFYMRSENSVMRRQIAVKKTWNSKKMRSFLVPEDEWKIRENATNPELMLSNVKGHRIGNDLRWFGKRKVISVHSDSVHSDSPVLRMLKFCRLSWSWEVMSLGQGGGMVMSLGQGGGEVMSLGQRGVRSCHWAKEGVRSCHCAKMWELTGSWLCQAAGQFI